MKRRKNNVKKNQDDVIITESTDDDKTIKFVCDIIELDIFEIGNIDTDDYLYDNYGIDRGLV